jgi:hypothetical protein
VTATSRTRPARSNRITRAPTRSVTFKPHSRLVPRC